MELRRTYSQAGTETEVFSSPDMKDFMKHISSLGEDVFFAVDARVMDTFRLEALPGATVSVIGGDGNKTIEQLKRIIAAMEDAGVDRDTRIVAIGGGVTLDLTAAAVASSFRDSRLTFVPTTIMAMTDGSIGGRCGINSGKKRYVCRDVRPADEIIMNADFIAKTGLENNRNGFGEVLKHALISPSPELLDMLFDESTGIKALEREAIEKMLLLSMDVKASYVEAAVKFPSAEKVLDFGHRFAFAFSSLGGDGGIRHGEAVVWGMARALDLGAEESITEPSFREKAMELFSIYGYDTEYRFPRDSARRLIEEYGDAYGVDGHEFILLKDRGKPVFRTVESDEIPWLVS